MYHYRHILMYHYTHASDVSRSACLPDASHVVCAYAWLQARSAYLCRSHMLHASFLPSFHFPYSSPSLLSSFVYPLFPSILTSLQSSSFINELERRCTHAPLLSSPSLPLPSLPPPIPPPSLPRSLVLQHMYLQIGVHMHVSISLIHLTPSCHLLRLTSTAALPGHHTNTHTHQPRVSKPDHEDVAATSTWPVPPPP